MQANVSFPHPLYKGINLPDLFKIVLKDKSAVLEAFRPTNLDMTCSVILTKQLWFNSGKNFQESRSQK